MPKIAELREIDGHVWARLEMANDAGAVTFWTEAEKEAACHAYVTALALDQETVERVARAIELCEVPYSSEHVALAALKSLTAKE